MTGPAIAASGAIALLVFASPADACRHFSIWNYPWPQKCAVRTAQQEAPPPSPPPRPEEPPPDIPLPSLEHMEFPPDATGDWERLKGIGLLRQYFEDHPTEVARPKVWEAK